MVPPVIVCSKVCTPRPCARLRGSVYVDSSIPREKLRRPSEPDAFSRGVSQSLKPVDESKLDFIIIMGDLVYEICMIMLC